jgi:hypothetical protein
VAVVEGTADPGPLALMGIICGVWAANLPVETMVRNHTAVEYRRWLAEVGLVDLDTVRFTAPGANGAMLARNL